MAHVVLEIAAMVDPVLIRRTIRAALVARVYMEAKVRSSGFTPDDKEKDCISAASR
jgi:hypothetical protein